MSTTRGPKSRKRQWLHWHPPLYMPVVLFRQQPHEYRVVKKDISRSNVVNVYLFIGSWEAIYSGTPVNLDSANSNPLIFLAWIPGNSNHLSDRLKESIWWNKWSCSTCVTGWEGFFSHLKAKLDQGFCARHYPRIYNRQTVMDVHVDEIKVRHAKKCNLQASQGFLGVVAILTILTIALFLKMKIKIGWLAKIIFRTLSPSLYRG